MTKKHSTKKALVASILTLCMCFTMLIGTTFAWFTDSVTSSGNVIKSGTLDIEFENYNYETGKWETASENAIFNYDKWEPGYTQKVNLRVINKGTLALKWMAAITTSQSLSKLADVINVYVRANDKFNAEAESSVAGYIDAIDTRDLSAAVAAGELSVCTLRQFIENCSAVTKGNLKAGDTAYLGLILQMDPEANNDYQNLDLGGKFDITILATQMAAEKDSIDEKYDENAEFPHFVYGVKNVAEGTNVYGDYEIPLHNLAGGKQGSASVPAGAVAANATAVSATVKKVDTDPNFTVASDKAVTTLDVTVTGLKENNDVPVRIVAHVPADLTGIKLYHYNDEIPYTYQIINGVGILRFESAEFSPFNIVYDYVPTEEELTDVTIPTAIVTENPELANVVHEWAEIPSGWDLSLSNKKQTLEAVYTFKAPHTKESVQNNAFKNWYCDYYVMCDKSVPAGSIVLGGNYGIFGWVAFDSPIDVAANEAIPLLGSVVTIPWTYNDIVNNVGEFKCGVAHTDHALDGATFTVMLRLTNPENENEYYNVNTVEYKFPKCIVSTVGELKTALENGGNIVLADDIELTETLMAKNDVVIDLNGNAITAPSNGNMFHSQSNAAPSMTITSSTAGAAINISGGDTSVLLGYGSTVIENVTINVTGCDNWSPNPFNVYGDLTLGEGTVVNVDYLGTALISNNGAVNVVIDGAEINIGTFKTNGTAIITLNQASTLEIKNTKITIDEFVLSPFGGDSLVSKADGVTIENCTFDVTDSNEASCKFEAIDGKYRLVQNN